MLRVDDEKNTVKNPAEIIEIYCIFVTYFIHPIQECSIQGCFEDIFIWCESNKTNNKIWYQLLPSINIR